MLPLAFFAAGTQESAADMNFEMPTGPKSSQVDVRRGDADDVKVRAL